MKVLKVSLIILVLVGIMGVFNSVPASATAVAFTSSSSDGSDYRGDSTYGAAWGASAATATYNSSTGISIGQYLSGGLYQVARSFLYFDTSSIPDSATITSAILKVYGWVDNSATDFDIVVQTGGVTYPHDPFVVGDYNKANYSSDGGSLSTASFTISGYNSIVLNSTGISWINKTGTTKLALRSSRDIAGTTPGGPYEMVYVYANEQGAGYRPELDITYVTAPAITPKAATNVSLLSAKLNSLVTDDGGDTTCQVRFGYGTISYNMSYFESYTTKTAWVDGYHTNSNPSVNATGLTANTIYYYRVQVKNSFSTITSTDEIFFDTTDTYAVLSDYTTNTTSTGILSGNPLAPPQLYTELDTSKVPGGQIVTDVLAQSDTPPALWWFPFIFLGIGIFSLLIFGLTCRNGAEGSLLLMSITIESGLMLFGIMGVANTSSLIPLWPAFMFPIPSIAIILSRKHLSWT